MQVGLREARRDRAGRPRASNWPASVGLAVEFRRELPVGLQLSFAQCFDAQELSVVRLLVASGFQGERVIGRVQAQLARGGAVAIELARPTAPQELVVKARVKDCLLYTSPSPRD
eukprot:488597-Alexandrium_andersonii.AAC.1